MPIYEYECVACHHQHEFLVLNPTDEELAELCPKCGCTANRIPSLPSYAKIKGSRVATTWCGKQGAAASV